MKVLVVYYSLYGHVYRLGQEVAEGAKSVEGVEADLRRVPETLSREVLEKMGAVNAQEKQSHIPIGQMRQFLDSTGQLWMSGSLVGKAGSVFVSTNTQHGGQESTILSFHATLLHQGMVIVGLPYAFKEQMNMDEITGCSPYGASTIASTDGSRMPTDNELAGARFQGEHVAKIARKLTA